MPVEWLSRISNAELFFSEARPGMLGLLAAAAPGRVLPDLIRWATGQKSLGGRGEPSLWSHSFLILDRRVAFGVEEILIAESTWIPAHQRSAPDIAGAPDWDGPQWSVVVARPAGMAGPVTGQDERRSLRRYRSDLATPNLALIDLGLSAKDVATVQERAWASFGEREGYGTSELLGTVIAGLNGTMDQPNLFDSPNVFCAAYVRDLLAGLVPELDNLFVHPSNTTCEHLFLALRHRCRLRGVVRSASPLARTPEVEVETLPMTA